MKLDPCFGKTPGLGPRHGLGLSPELKHGLGLRLELRQGAGAWARAEAWAGAGAVRVLLAAATPTDTHTEVNFYNLYAFCRADLLLLSVAAQLAFLKPSLAHQLCLLPQQHSLNKQ